MLSLLIYEFTNDLNVVGTIICSLLSNRYFLKI